VTALGMGSTQEAFNDFGAIINDLKNFDKDIADANKMSFVYNFDSAAFKG